MSYMFNSSWCYDSACLWAQWGLSVRTILVAKDWADIILTVQSHGL